MYSTAEQTSDFAQTDAECKRLIAELASRIGPDDEDLLIPASDPVDTGESFYLLTEGMALYQQDKQTLLYLEEGDLVGLHELRGLMSTRVVFPLGVRVHRFNRKAFTGRLAQDADLREKWDRYISKQISLYLSIITALHRDLAEVDPAIHHFQSGETIMLEGSVPGMIFTLIQGQAEVSSGEVSMGEIGTGQIFGAYAAVTGTPRQATVTAITPCLALSVNRAAFLSMLRFQSLQFLQVYSDQTGSRII